MFPHLFNPTIQVSVSGVPWSLENVTGFPYIWYLEQQVKYDRWESWFTGEALREMKTITKTQKQVAKYPVRINPIKSTVRKHTSVLFGSSPESIVDGGVPIRFIPDVTKSSNSDNGANEAAKAQELRISNALSEVFVASGGGALFFQNGSLAQYMGGCVFSAKWRADLGIIEVENPNPRTLVGIPDGHNYWRLKEAWIIEKITNEQLLAFNLGEGFIAQNGPGVYYFIEHWTPTTHEVKINEFDVLDNDGLPYSGPNPFGLVPVMYIPHFRPGTDFVGESMITDAVQGIVKEMNNAWSDVGDAVNDDAHQMIWHRNVTGSPKIDNIGGRPVVNLGSQAGLSAGEGNPDMQGVSLKSASDTMISYVEKLDTLYRRETDHPAVADGEDEGSQRSAATLNTRMWALEAHADTERVFWTVGLINFAKILLTMMAIKGLNKITLEDVKVPLTIQWRPMLPKDRKELVDEIAVRDSTGTASKEHLMEMAGDVQDPTTMFEEVVDEQKQLAAAKPQPQVQPGQSKTSGSANGDAAAKKQPQGKPQSKSKTA